MSVETQIPPDLPATLRVVDRPVAAAVLGCSVSELDRMRSQSRGPKVVRFGRRIVYRLSDLEQFLADCAGADE